MAASLRQYGRAVGAWALAALALGSALPAAAAGAHRAAAAPATEAHTQAAEAEAARWPAVTAEFSLRVSPAPGSGAALRRQRWVFQRSVERVSLSKRELTVASSHPAGGEIEDRWLRDPDGRLRFERVVHALRQVADYSPGELAALGIQTTWASVATLVDPASRAALRPQGPARGAVQDLASADGRLRLRWDPRLGLPQTIHRRLPDGRTATLTLQRAATPEVARREGWGPDEARSADYRRIDAADFGDLTEEPLVKLAEALDQLSGWRQPHRHE